MVITNDLECSNLIQKDDNTFMQVEININKMLSDYLNCDLSENSIKLLIDKYGSPYLAFDSILTLLGSRNNKAILSRLTNPIGVNYSIYRMQRFVDLLTSYRAKDYGNILHNVMQLLLLTDQHYNDYPLDTYSSCLCFGNILENLSYGTNLEVELDDISRDEYITLPINCKISLLVENFHYVLKTYNYKYEGIFLNYIDLLSPIIHVTTIAISDDKIVSTMTSCSEIIQTYSDIDFEVLMRCAREIIESEMRIHVYNVYPNFIVSKEGYNSGWNFTNLFAALYMKIQLIYLNSRALKKCENPTCNEYFELPSNNTVKKYCSTRCAQLMAKRKQREREKEI